ncbi:Uma2 family endonuclease [Desulfosporosinus fructosivorans]|uniref:Uma2 family endonuclease n=1 Tax=Desulfosporosinus fructosivorans TaxID=2018669 RepID=A0A4Z0R291_9FIRM|nr:Uma2 family endonuclease [Desulfosporosinus fructosivorans]TGE35746.1 Uma2 family endonuclease [Desulfosporosinus fructosivorans]
MSPTPKELSASYSYADYLTWPEDERWELIDGVPLNMTPAPTPKHQEILGEVFRILANWLKGNRCKVYMAPFDVRLAGPETLDSAIDKVVQPDISAVCDPQKIDDRGCLGAPDMIVEILSPSTFKKDLGIKLTLYESSGVKEYWVVYPLDETVMVFILQNGQDGKPTVYSVPDEIPVELFNDLTIPLESVFR